MTLIAAAPLLAAACTGGSGAGPKAEGLPEGHGGTLRIVFTRSGGFPYLAGGYDPQVAGDTATFEFARCCLFRTLMSYNGQPTEGGGTTPRPDLADGPPSVSSDGLTWTFHLRPGINYAPPFQHHEIVARDVIRGLERALAPVKGKVAREICGGTPCQLGGFVATFFLGVIQGARGYANGGATTISGLEAPDAHTLRVRLVHPEGSLAYLFALPATSPIPPKPGDPTARFGAADGHDLDYGHGFAVGGGPYMVEGSGAVDFSRPPRQQKRASGAAEHSFTLVRNPSWDPASDDLRVAYPDRIVVTAANDLATGETMVQRDHADLVGDFTAPPSLVERLQRSPKLSDRVFVDPSDVITTMTLNLAVPPLDDIQVRKALNLVIDRQTLRPILTRFVSTANVSTHIGLDSVESNLLLNYAPYGGGQGATQQAKAEMAKSRYDSNGDGKCDAAACKRVVLVYPGADRARRGMADAIKADAAPLGIHVVLAAAADTRWRQMTSDPSSGVTMDLVTYSKDFPSGSDFFPSIFASGTLTNPNLGDPTLLGASHQQLRRWGYTIASVPSVDDRMRLCEEQIFSAQATCWASFDQYLTEQVVPWVPLLAWTGAAVVSSRVQKFSWDQSTPFPSVALDRIELKLGSRTP